MTGQQGVHDPVHIMTCLSAVQQAARSGAPVLQSLHRDSCAQKVSMPTCIHAYMYMIVYAYMYMIVYAYMYMIVYVHVHDCVCTCT